MNAKTAWRRAWAHCRAGNFAYAATIDTGLSTSPPRCILDPIQRHPPSAATYRFLQYQDFRGITQCVVESWVTWQYGPAIDHKRVAIWHKSGINGAQAAEVYVWQDRPGLSA